MGALKTKVAKDALVLPSKEQQEVKEARKELGSELVLDSRAEELAELCGSENEEEPESEESEHGAEEGTRKEVGSKEERSEGESSGAEEIARARGGKRCVFALLKCAESEFLREASAAR